MFPLSIDPFQCEGAIGCPGCGLTLGWGSEPNCDLVTFIFQVPVKAVMCCIWAAKATADTNSKANREKEGSCFLIPSSPEGKSHCPAESRKIICQRGGIPLL